ncbi:hypothetical protein AYY16_08060 [Morganella psychrotolerans]|nr:hypothetical protein AYY16_08060 [Morganella psychrotolerans]
MRSARSALKFGAVLQIQRRTVTETIQVIAVILKKKRPSGSVPMFRPRFPPLLTKSASLSASEPA